MLCKYIKSARNNNHNLKYLIFNYDDYLNKFIFDFGRSN